MVCRELRDWLGPGDSRFWNDAVHSQCCSQCILYSQYALLGVCCSRCMPFSVYDELGVSCTQCMLYSVYAVLGVCCTRDLLTSAKCILVNGSLQECLRGCGV